MRNGKRRWRREGRRCRKRGEEKIVWRKGSEEGRERSKEGGKTYGHGKKCGRLMAHLQPSLCVHLYVV